MMFTTLTMFLARSYKYIFFCFTFQVPAVGWAFNFCCIFGVKCTTPLKFTSSKCDVLCQICYLPWFTVVD
jgi:hypothetical protein